MINPNEQAIVDAYTSGKRGIVLEGGSRSGKTWSVIDFFVALSSQTTRPKVVNLVKETYNGFKTTLYNDFNRRLPQFPMLESPFRNAKDVASFDLFSAHFNLMGADQPSKYEGAASDFFWINEALPVKRAIFDQLEMRCSSFWILDYNPNVSDHWIYNTLGKREDVVFFHSTLLDNPFIGKWEKKKILGYDPSNPVNIEQGTADDYMWEVYGLGKRASPQGVIHKNVTWIDAFPEDCEIVIYGLDFGFTNSPTALVKVGKSGRNIYLQKLYYSPCDNAKDLSDILSAIISQDVTIFADSASPGMITDLRLKGWNVFGAKKFPGSIKYGIDLMKQFIIHIVRDADFRKEQENYKWRVINGISLNEPVDDFNHLWDGSRYACQMQFRAND